MLDKLKTFYYNFKHFFINVWRFREQLWSFRTYDFQHNLNIYIASLETTRDFMNSEKALCASAKDTAQEIDYVIQLFDDYKNSLKLAEKEVGYTIANTIGNKKENEHKLIELLEKSNQIEEDSWNEAFDHMKKNMRKWWD